MLHTVEAAPIRPTRATWIRRHPLSAFFAWFFTVGQAFAFAPLVVDTPIPDQVFIIGSTLVGLFLPALVITRVADGPEAVRRLLRSYVRWRVGLRWYAIVLLPVPLIGLALGVAFFGLPEAMTAGSLFLVGLLHAAGNATAAGSGFVTDSLLRHLYPAHGMAVGIFHLLAFFVIGLVVLAVTKGRLGLPSSKESEK